MIDNLGGTAESFRPYAWDEGFFYTQKSHSHFLEQIRKKAKLKLLSFDN